MKKFSSTIELIKYLAIISMIIDHIGLTFYDGDIYFRFIGRFALIGFSFILAYNYRFNTQDKRAYKLRLLKWAIISQVPYMIFDTSPLNIMFLLLMGLYAVDIIEQLLTQDNIIRPTLYLSTIIILSYFTGYFLFGVLVIVFFYYMHDSKANLILLYLSVALLNYDPLYAIASTTALLIIMIMLYIDYPLKIKRVKGYLFYAFYPVHIILIIALKEIT